MTVLMPRAFSFSSRFDPRNLSGPPWRAHSPSRGINPGSITSAGVAAPLLPTRLYHTIDPAVRAASCSRLTLGIVATQRGRAPHPAFIMSRMSKAVVEPSTVTALTSGRGGGFTVAQSSRISAAEDDTANTIMSAPAATAAPRNRVRMSNIVPSFGFIEPGPSHRFESCPPLGLDRVRFAPRVFKSSVGLLFAAASSDGAQFYQ